MVHHAALCLLLLSNMHTHGHASMITAQMHVCESQLKLGCQRPSQLPAYIITETCGLSCAALQEAL